MGKVKHVGAYDVMQDLSTFIMGPQSIVDQFANVAGAKVISWNFCKTSLFRWRLLCENTSLIYTSTFQYNKNFQLYEIECAASFPSLDITIGSTKYSINSDKLIVKVTSRGHFFVTFPFAGNSFAKMRSVVLAVSLFTRKDTKWP